MIPVYARIPPVHDEYTVYGSVARVVTGVLGVPVYLYADSRAHACVLFIFSFPQGFIFSYKGAVLVYGVYGNGGK